MQPFIFAAAFSLCAQGEAVDVVPGHEVLRQHCLECHGERREHPGLDLRDREALLPQDDDAETKPFLAPGAPDQSRIWEVVRSGRMPPDDHAPLTEAQKSELQDWIASGAPFPATSAISRPYVGEASIRRWISDDLTSRAARDRPFVRYLSLRHLWNSSVGDDHLALVRAAASKLLNSLSSSRVIATPTSVDEHGVLLRFDLRDYGWTDERHWRTLLGRYPYALTHEDAVADDILAATRSELPYVRADWFVFAASRPPLYHQLLNLPEGEPLPDRLDGLERLLGVSFAENIVHERVVRGGLSGENSGPSEHSRIAERHESRYGYYWVSYDSGSDAGRRNFFDFPLGPRQPNLDGVGAFEHDGGEVIFSLPNGMQGYFLAKADGQRIDIGPQEIVRDPNRFSGSYDIVNGVSCFGCHRAGIISFRDAIRNYYEGRASEIASRVRRIYPDNKTLENRFREDRERHLAALRAAVGAFLSDEAIQQVEPIQAVSKAYDRPLRLADAARELGLPTSSSAMKESDAKATTSEFGVAIRFSSELKRLQLQPLASGESISRSQWETAFGGAARELGVGTPLVVE